MTGSNQHNWDYPNPFKMRFVPSMHDIDGLNHTNNAVYVQWCERIGWSHSESMGLGIAQYNALDRAMAIRRGEYNYLLPTFLTESLTLGTWLTHSDGKLTLERRFQLIRENDGVTVLRGLWELVCIQISSGRPKRMPHEFTEKYLLALVDAKQEHLL